MQRLNSPEISPTEWRWVIIFSGLLVALTLLPYAWAFALNVPVTNWQFMGILPNPQDGATYIAKIAEGARGQWLFTLPYTPEVHTGAAINEFYLFLGHIAALAHLPPLLMYHIARLITGFIMYISLYQLGATIWNRLRARRLFFSILAIGSGLGWLALVLHLSSTPTDLTIPESIPLYATYVNPHFPLAIALIALLAAIFIVVFRPGFEAHPTVNNGGLMVIVCTILLCIVQPQGWVPIVCALVIYVLIQTWRTRRIPQLELSWVSLAILPAIPFFVYYYVVSHDHGAFEIWSAQNVTPSPIPTDFILGFGLILLIAIPGIWRGIRFFERDGDRFMIIWLVANAILLYVPLSLQRRLSIGMIIPLTYFAVRALEDFWFDRVGTRWRDAALIAVFVFMIPTNVLAFLIPLFGVHSPADGIKNFILLPADYGKAITWLNTQADQGQVVLGSPSVSLWIPAYANERVVYGHPFETLNASQKVAEVKNWYGAAQVTDCTALLNKYAVRYIITGPQEDGLRANGNAGCQATLSQPIQQFGSVSIYEVH